MLRLAIPSKGNLYEGTLAFFESCGLKISRPNPRRYTAAIRALPGAEVLLHRTPDIIEKVAAGEIDDLLVLFDDLGFGRCELIVAVPEAWIDVSSWHDLADLAVELHNEGRS